MQPLISVIVPIYNVEKYLNKCVESIVNQTYKNLEIILVDDGSPDNCPKMCDEWAEKDRRIKVIHKENGGVSSARNAGLDIVSGDYIGFVDPDDYIKPEMFEILISGLKADNADFVICGSYRLENEIADEYENNTPKVTEIINKPDIVKSYLESQIDPGVPAKLYDKSVISDIRFNVSKSIGEDFLFNYFVLKNCNKVVMLENKLYFYFNRENSATHVFKLQMVNRWQNTKYILESKTLNDEEYDVLFKAYASELMCCLRELLKSGNDELINSVYQQIIDEIKEHLADFIKIDNLNYINRFSFRLIALNDNLFKRFYKIYLKLKD